MRYSLTPIDAATFPSATRAAGVPAPRSAGSREEAVIRGLTPSTDYWIALVTRDEYGNPSPLSNVIAVRTTEPPVAVTAPAAIETTLRTGQNETVALRVRNDGAGLRLHGSGGRLRRHLQALALRRADQRSGPSGR